MKRLSAAILIACLFAATPAFAAPKQEIDAAPMFSLPNSKGSKLALGALKGKVVLLTFWAPWCDPCREELPALETLRKKYADAGFEVVGIAIKTSASEVEAFTKRHQLTYPMLLDARGDTARAYRAIGLPSSVLVGRDGTIKYRHRGYGSDYIPMYEQEIRALLDTQ